VAATVAGLHMRTWSNALPSTAHPEAASVKQPYIRMAKSASRFRLRAAEPYALAKGRAAADAEMSARRTVRALD